MNASDVEFVGDLVRQRAGLLLSADKVYLLESRLGPVARREGFQSIPALVAALKTRRDERMAARITEAMTTSETYFFRDKGVFEHVREQMLPALVKARPPGSAIRIWCAGCSSGQEAYSLAMIVDDLADKLAGRRVEILASDLNTQTLEKARAGVYSQFEVQRGLPVRALVKHFEQQGEVWRVRPEIRRHVAFAPINLLDDMKPLGLVDVAFCRNVLSAFDPDVRKDVLARLAAQIAGDGYLVLGTAETAAGLGGAFVGVKARAGVYERPSTAAASENVA